MSRVIPRPDSHSVTPALIVVNVFKVPRFALVAGLRMGSDTMVCLFEMDLSMTVEEASGARKSKKRVSMAAEDKRLS